MTTRDEGVDGSPPRRIALRLAYEGTRYSGWQVQPGRATVQGTLAEAIRTISGETVMPNGASRTDAGVHALDQVVAFTTTSSLPAGVWARALNARLPPDITVREGREVAPEFDPVSAAVRKRYRYRDPRRPVAAGAPAAPRLALAGRGSTVERMAEAATSLVGEHDFTSFETIPSTRLSKVRTTPLGSRCTVRPSRTTRPAPRCGSRSKGTDFCTTWCGSSPARW